MPALAVLSSTSRPIVMTYGDFPIARVGEARLGDFAGDDPDAHRARQVQHGQEEQGVVDVDEVDGAAAEQSAGGAGRRDAAEARAGFTRIEQFGGERPEPGQEQRAESRDVQIDQHGDPGLALREQPLRRVCDRAQQEARGHHRARAEAGEQPRPDRHGRDDDRRGHDDHGRQAGDAGTAQEHGLANGFGGGLMREHEARDGHGQGREPRRVHAPVLQALQHVRCLRGINRPQ
jgi:hypothetical protein